METGKTYWQIEQIGERKRQRKKGLEEREKKYCQRERRRAWVDFDRWLKSTLEYF